MTGIDAIHRVVEQQAVAAGDTPAITDGAHVVSYRDLNQRANALARRLMSAGLQRGSHVVARLDRSPELVITLLAVLKAGSAYTWAGPGEGSAAIWIARDLTLEGAYERVDVGDLRTPLLCASPNLSAMVRGSDVACLLLASGNSPRAVCHQEVTGVHADAAAGLSLEWNPAGSAVAHWSTLMAGGTLTVPVSLPLRTAA